ncbi:MAG: YraN family protein [Candidatus Shapirobacteria bacterium]
MKRDNFIKGRVGEIMAKKYLEDLGWKTIDQNFYTRWGEVDLIMDDGEKLVFVEVKYKGGANWGRPEDMIGPHKLRQIKLTAGLFLERHPELKGKFSSFRIDAVCISQEIKHYRNIGG